ncbi:MAG: hypothetical protein ACE5GQ_08600, partial [Nitrospinales bacterium]
MRPAIALVCGLFLCIGFACAEKGEEQAVTAEKGEEQAVTAEKGREAPSVEEQGQELPITQVTNGKSAAEAYFSKDGKQLIVLAKTGDMKQSQAHIV